VDKRVCRQERTGKRNGADKTKPEPRAEDKRRARTRYLCETIALPRQAASNPEGKNMDAMERWSDGRTEGTCVIDIDSRTGHLEAGEWRLGKSTSTASQARRPSDPVKIYTQLPCGATASQRSSIASNAYLQCTELYCTVPFLNQAIWSVVFRPRECCLLEQGKPVTRW